MWSQENPNLKEPIMKAERAGTGNPYSQKTHLSQVPDQSHRVNSNRSTQRRRPQRPVSTTQAPCPQPGGELNRDLGPAFEIF